MSSNILILNGPNLNMLGTREVEIYGTDTLADIETKVRARAEDYDMAIDFRQSNSEAELVDWIQQARGAFDGLILNAGAYTHTSIAILDALNMVDMPIIEVHLSNIFQRESFRRESFISGAANGLITGFGATGYLLALEAMAQLIKTGTQK
ncbi:MAG: type II 3-dehydroquinate dehydratase [Alphaproteobacteria bacterium]|nr:type II 3-dehydroquinate dehydratase [Alphaproteobacteria bacterium]